MIKDKCLNWSEAKTKAKVLLKEQKALDSQWDELRQQCPHKESVEAFNLTGPRVDVCTNCGEILAKSKPREEDQIVWVVNGHRQSLYIKPVSL